MELTRNQRAACRLPISNIAFPTHRGFRELIAQTFGRLRVQTYGFATSSKNGRRHYWICTCDCGGWSVVETYLLTSGATVSCGCRRAEAAREMSQRNIVHGECDSPEYKTWERIKARCSNPKLPKYPLYSGRGVKVCSRWRDSFEAFDMGRRPPDKTSIDRFPNRDGDYEPGNCRWADAIEQNNNRRAFA